MEFGYIVIGVIVIGLIYHLTKSEKSSAPVVETKSEVPSTAELKKLTKQQLLDLADKKSLKVKRSGTKAEVVSSIRQQLK
tara:strand:- start:47 stop:286 length:240 start_codon:yes stop_codon:yes gene_type:complete